MSADEVVVASARFTLAAAIRAAASLDLASALRGGPRPAVEVAEAVGLDRRMCGMLLGALASEGIFSEHEPGVFALNPAAEALLPTNQGGRREVILGWTAHPAVYRALERVDEGVRTGRPTFEIVHGMGFFQWLAAHPVEEQAYQAAVGGQDPREFASLFDHVDLAQYGVVADIGGGGGGLLVSAVRRWPHLQGMLVDLPSVVAATAARLQAAGLGERITVHAADGVNNVPGGADCYLMSTVLRYLDDPGAVRVISHIAATRGDVILVEMPLPAGPAQSPRAMKSLIQACLTGGADRTIAQLTDLLTCAGFTAVRSSIWEEPFHIIQGTNPARSRLA
jgi:hypothetical protein